MIVDDRESLTMPLRMGEWIDQDLAGDSGHLLVDDDSGLPVFQESVPEGEHSHTPLAYLSPPEFCERFSGSENSRVEFLG